MITILRFCTALCVFALSLLVWQAQTIYAQTPVNAGGTPESFAQLITIDIPGSAPTASPAATPTPSVSANATMSIESSPSCESPNTSTSLGYPYPAFLSQSIPLDSNALPVQMTYFSSYYYFYGLPAHYIAVAYLDVSCGVAGTNTSGSPFSNSYNFAIPIYFCDTGSLDQSLSGGPQAAIGLSTSGCQNRNVPAACPFSPAGVIDVSGYSHNASTENLAVFVPPQAQGSSEETPAVAVDVQLLYNGFSVSNRDGLSPYLVRVACSALSSFSNNN